MKVVVENATVLEGYKMREGTDYPPTNPVFAGGQKMFLKTTSLFTKTFGGPGRRATHPPFHTRTQEHEYLIYR